MQIGRNSSVGIFSSSNKNVAVSSNLLDAMVDVKISLLFTVMDSPIKGVSPLSSPNLILLIIVSLTLASVTIVSSAITTPAIRFSIVIEVTSKCYPLPRKVSPVSMFVTTPNHGHSSSGLCTYNSQ